MSWKILAAYRTFNKYSGVLIFELTTMGSTKKHANCEMLGGKPEEVCGSITFGVRSPREQQVMMFELAAFAVVSALAVSSATALEISCNMDHCISRYGAIHGCEGQSPWTECLLFNSRSTCQIQANVKNLVKYCFDNAMFVGNYSTHECSVKVENRNTNLTEEDSADWTCITTEDYQLWKTFGVIIS